jgi:hypothetical protein
MQQENNPLRRKVLCALRVFPLGVTSFAVCFCWTAAGSQSPAVRSQSFRCQGWFTWRLDCLFLFTTFWRSFPHFFPQTRPLITAQGTYLTGAKHTKRENFVVDREFQQCEAIKAVRGVFKRPPLRFPQPLWGECPEIATKN